jgi:hypothetical protein
MERRSSSRVVRSGSPTAARYLSISCGAMGEVSSRPSATPPRRPGEPVFIRNPMQPPPSDLDAHPLLPQDGPRATLRGEVQRTYLPIRSRTPVRRSILSRTARRNCLWRLASSPSAANTGVGERVHIPRRCVDQLFACLRRETEATLDTLLARSARISDASVLSSITQLSCECSTCSCDQGRDRSRHLSSCSAPDRTCATSGSSR